MVMRDLPLHKQTLTLAREPRDELYRNIVGCAASECDTGLLVVRPEVRLANHGQRVLTDLGPYTIDASESGEWPGTKLLDATAKVYRFRLADPVVEMLQHTVAGLFEWQQPDLPEDLCFLDKNEPWLVSIAHERDAYFCLSKEQRAILIERVPALTKYLQRPS